MKRGLVLGALVVVWALLAAAGAARQTPSAASIQVDKVRDNLYVLRGGGGNTAAFITAKGVTLVDTKVPAWGKPILEKLKEITEKPVTTIINTHTHADHVGGNVEFPTTVDVVTHENTAKLMREMSPVTGGPEQPNVFKEKNGLSLPRRTFKDRMTLGNCKSRSRAEVPERFQKDGYLTPEEIQQLSRQPIAAQAARLRANVDVVWNETK